MTDRMQPTGKLLFQKELDQIIAQGCQAPGCTEKHDDLYLNPQCHVGAGVQVRYDSRDKALHVECRRCEKPIADIKVAEE